MKFFSMKLLALLSVAMVVYSAPAISANVPAIAASFPEVDAVYVGLLTTIPSLFLLLGIFTTSMIEKRIGKKYTMVTGLVIVAIFGTLPVWYQGSFPVLFLSRAILGFGIGLFNRLAIQMISLLFQNKAKALGLESAVGGLGGIFMTLLVGQLVKISWEISFFVYGFALISLFFVQVFIPNETKATTDAALIANVTVSKERKQKSFVLGVLLFLIVVLFINYNLQITPLLLEKGIGDATDGSNMIAAIATGAFIAGNAFGLIYRRLHRWLLPVAALLAGSSIYLTYPLQTVGLLLGCSLLLGFAFRSIMPFFTHLLTTGGEAEAKFGTIVSIVAYNLGVTLAPYASRLLILVSGNETAGMQMILSGVLLVMIGIVSGISNRYFLYFERGTSEELG
ncbi:MFS transporter [Enterococcus sp. DIV1059_2]|uniref:MFS transporter n=1 Tax=Enterococcus sp. DIV1059_2 TaxID=2774664 RepID=UPI003F2560B2